MKPNTKIAVAAVMIAAAATLALSGCAPKAAAPSKTTKGAPAPLGVSPDASKFTTKTVGQDTIYMTPTKTYDAADFPMTAMTGAPSNIPYFKPVHDEGILNRAYPATDNKTYKFLDLMNQCIAPQWYYMFYNAGGTVNKDVASTGYKISYLQDSGHTKIFPNLELGYYDFAWMAGNLVTELWSGNVSQYQELWRTGDDYVIVGASYEGGIDLLSSPSITSLKDLAGKTVGIMNPSYETEAELNHTLATVGLATESAGGNVKVIMATPGMIMNDILQGKVQAGYVWGKYEVQLKKQSHWKTLVPWTQEGYGSDIPLLYLIARRDIVQQHPDVVQAVVQANYDATKMAQASNAWVQPDYAMYEAYWVKNYGAKPNILQPTQDQLIAEANPSYLHMVVDYMTKCGYFKIPYTYDQLVDDSFYQNVKK